MIRSMKRAAPVIFLSALCFGATPALASSACLRAVQGNFVEGGLVSARVSPGSTVTIDGESLDVLPDGTTLFGFHREAPEQSLVVVESAAGERCEQSVQVASREYNIQRVEGVPQKTVTPPKEQLERIARERAKVAAAKDRRFERPDLVEAAIDGFVWPTVGPISGVYGSQRYYNGTPRSPHYGVDVAVPTGTPVAAPAPGIVTLAEPDLFYSGGTVILDHGYGLSSSFLHMSKVRVAVGQELQAGDILGEVGATGRATGPHLDWRMSWRNRRIDPQLLVPPMPAPGVGGE